MTSGQYSYLLLRKLQTYVSCTDSSYRAYLYNFFGEIFNNTSVVIDEIAYNRFNDLMERDIEYAARRNLQTPSSIYYDENYNENAFLLQEAFRSIGINLEIVLNNTDIVYPEKLIFTLPSGEQKILDGLGTYWYDKLFLNSQVRNTRDYFLQMLPYYRLEHEEVQDLAVIGTNAAGYNTRWTFDAATSTLEITGTGSLAASWLWTTGVGYLGLIADMNTPLTMIIGAGVSRLLKEALCLTSLTIVDLHGEFDDIMLDDEFYLRSKNNGTWIFYTDNRKLREYPYPDNITIEWHTLSEWEG